MTTAPSDDRRTAELDAGLEALLFNAEEPLDVDELATVLDVGSESVAARLEHLAGQYESQGRGLAIREVAGGWRMYTAPRAFEYVERYVLAGRSGRLSQAALETLAVVAYKQPISRQEIGDVRGVNADGAVRTLAQRGFVEEVGRAEGPGQAILYGTTTRFLEELGLTTLDELPPLTDFLAEDTPDEPGLDELAAVRKRLAAGGTISEESGETPVDQAADRRRVRREQEREMDELTASLERATRSAVAQLRDAVDAAEEREDPAEVADDDPSEGS